MILVMSAVMVGVALPAVLYRIGALRPWIPWCVCRPSGRDGEGFCILFGAESDHRIDAGRPACWNKARREGDDAHQNGD